MPNQYSKDTNSGVKSDKLRRCVAECGQEVLKFLCSTLLVGELRIGARNKRKAAKILDESFGISKIKKRATGNDEGIRKGSHEELYENVFGDEDVTAPPGYINEDAQYWRFLTILSSSQANDKIKIKDGNMEWYFTKIENSFGETIAIFDRICIYKFKDHRKWLKTLSMSRTITASSMIKLYTQVVQNNSVDGVMFLVANRKFKGERTKNLPPLHANLILFYPGNQTVVYYVSN